MPLDDSSRRQSAEEELRTSEAKYRSIIQYSADGILLLDEDGVVVEWNASAERISGLPRSRVIGRAYWDIHNDIIDPERQTPAQHARIRQAIEGVCQSGQIPWSKNPGEVTFHLADGSRRRVEQTIFPIQSGRGFMVGAIMRDVTERREAEEALQRAHDELELRVEQRTAQLSQREAALIAANLELEVADRLKDEFLANMSHELRTPLNTVLILAESLQEGVYGPTTERQAKSLRTIEESGRHLLALINDVLDLGKIGAGKLSLEPNQVSVPDVCAASLRLIEAGARKKDLRVNFALDQDVSEIWADERRLKQMLSNLLSNAVKFTPPEGSIGLAVSGDSGQNLAHFTVHDTGIGIAAHELGRLFQPFAQLDGGLARQHEGAGLGLVLVRKFAEMHGGRVTVESQPGQGSRFTISLPWRNGCGS